MKFTSIEELNHIPSLYSYFKEEEEKKRLDFEKRRQDHENYLIERKKIEQKRVFNRLYQFQLLYNFHSMFNVARYIQNKQIKQFENFLNGVIEEDQDQFIEIKAIEREKFTYYDYILNKEKTFKDKLERLNLRYKKAILYLEKIIDRNNLNDNKLIVNKLVYTYPNINYVNLLENYHKYYNLIESNRFKEIMLKVYNKTHKTKISSYTKSFDKWLIAFPFIVERKINGIKAKLREQNKNQIKSRKAKENYKNSELRLHTLIKMLNSKGYYGFNLDLLRSKMKNLENDEIILDMINEFSDMKGNDNDMLEITKDNPYNNQQIKDINEKQDYEYLEYLNENLEQLTNLEMNDYIKLCEIYNYLDGDLQE